MYPSDGRVNSYSKPQYILDLVKILQGTPEMATILSSPFGHLFLLPTSRCSLSGKLVHNILCRQILSANSHEAWFTFGGQPFRFSISEFEHLTGLHCGPLPDRNIILSHQTPPSGSDWYWSSLIGDDDNVTIADIITILKSGKSMPGWRRLRLALIVIVEGILLCRTQPVTPSIKIVEMVRDVDFFMKYPWGRSSFKLTLRMIKVGPKVMSTAELVKKMKQSSVAIHGFPLALQLLAFQSIPSLLELLPCAYDTSTFVDSNLDLLPPLKVYHTVIILLLENKPKVRVIHVLQNKNKYGVDICHDNRIFALQSLISRGHVFRKTDWLGGDSSLTHLCLCSTALDRRCSGLDRCGEGTSNVHVSETQPMYSKCSDCQEFNAMVSSILGKDYTLEPHMKAYVETEFHCFLFQCHPRLRSLNLDTRPWEIG